MATDFSYNKVIYYDSEYCFPGTTKISEWRWAPGKLRVQTVKIGNGPIRVIDVWKEGNIWHEIFDLLEQGYRFVAHNAIADIRPDLCPEQILKYVRNGQIHDTIYMERLIHGMTDPIDGTIESIQDPDSDDDEEEYSEEQIDKFNKKPKHFALDKVIYRHTGVIVPKTYQDARTYFAETLSPKVLEYCKNDVKYLPQIYRQQCDLIKKLDLGQVVELNHKLLATSYIVQKYGVPINCQKLQDSRLEYANKAKELEEKLLSIMPKVSYTDVQLIDIYFDTYWTKGVGLAGITNKTNAKDMVKKRVNHFLTTSVWNWIEERRDQYLKAPNLNAPAQKLQSFKKLGYDLKDTSETTVKNFMSGGEYPVLESYLVFQKVNKINNTYLKNIDYTAYLRRDNTIKTTFTWVKALNGRSSASDMNVQQLPRELKTLYGTPEGMVKIEYDYSAIELMKMLNDYPQDDLVRLILDDSEDIHLYNAAKFFNQNYEDLKRRHKEKDSEVKKFRNAAKTVIYFLQYKTPKKPDEKFVTGTAKLMEIFKTDLGWELAKEEAEHMIITGENIIKKWTTEKLLIDGDISKLAKEDGNLQSELLGPIRRSAQELNTALEEGIITFKGALGMYYKFDLIRDHIYTPEKEHYDDARDEWTVKKEYVNSRSLYSCRVAGPIAIGAKKSVQSIQEELASKYGPDKARLGLFVHDSMTCYCVPEIKEDVEKILVTNMLKVMYDVGGFDTLPVYIEGGIEGEPEKKVGYHGKGIVGL
jgi:hypothetical protein